MKATTEQHVIVKSLFCQVSTGDHHSATKTRMYSCHALKTPCSISMCLVMPSFPLITLPGLGCQSMSMVTSVLRRVISCQRGFHHKIRYTRDRKYVESSLRYRPLPSFGTSQNATWKLPYENVGILVVSILV